MGTLKLFSNIFESILTTPYPTMMSLFPDFIPKSLIFNRRRYVPFIFSEIGNYFDDILLASIGSV